MQRSAMKGRLYIVFMIMVACAGQPRSSAQTAPATQSVFPSGVDVVTVDVVVLDRQGRPVEGLTQADFSVKENGDPQDVTAFQAVRLSEPAGTSRPGRRISTNAAGTDPSADRRFFIVFDDVNVSQFSAPRARDVIVGFIDRVLRTGDQVLIASSSGGAWWTGRLPEDRDSLVAFVGRLQGAHRPDTSAGRLWDHEAMAITLGRDRQMLAQVARRYFENNLIPEAYPVENREALDVSPGLALIQLKARSAYTEATARLRLSLRMLERVSAALMQARGRKTLLLVSEGFITDPSQPEFRNLVQSARRSNTAVHFIDVRSPEGLIGQAGMPGGNAEFGAAIEQQDTTTALAFAAREADGARSIAIDTGGRVVSGTNLLSGLAGVAAEADAHYLLGYSPTNARRDGTFRKIEVTVSRRDVEVRARSGYYAPSGKELPPPPPDTLDPAVRAALDAPFGASGIPLRLSSYVFGPQADGKVQVLLLAEAESAPLRLQATAGTYTATLDSYVVLHERDRGDVQRDERVVELAMPSAAFEQARRAGVPIRREFSLTPGRYQATLLLRDRASGLLGSVRHEFDVPAPGQLRISTPVITDTLQPAAAGQPARPVPIARRTFQAGSRILAAFDIYGFATGGSGSNPRVSVGYSLRRADGTEAAAVSPRLLAPGAAGRLSVAIGLTLPGDASGEYDFSLTIRDELAMRTLEDNEPLVIIPR